MANRRWYPCCATALATYSIHSAGNLIDQHGGAGEFRAEYVDFAAEFRVGPFIERPRAFVGLFANGSDGLVEVQRFRFRLRGTPGRAKLGAGEAHVADYRDLNGRRNGEVLQ